MRNDRGVSPLIATLLLVALTVSVTVLYTTVATDIIDVYGSDDYALPNVDSDFQDGEISVQLLDKGDMSTVVLQTPSGSNLDDVYLETVGKESAFTVSENDTGTYSLSAVNPDGDRVLLENLQVGESAEDSVGDLALVIVDGSVEGGEDSISFELKNTGNEEVSITEFQVEKVNLDNLVIDTESPPSQSAPGDDEIFIDSNPDDGRCGMQPSKQLPIDEKERFENCKAGSEPSVADSGSTMETTFNGVDADKATDYIGVSPSPAFTDMAVNLYGPKDESVRIPLTLDTFVVPRDDSYVYEPDINSDKFESDPSTVLIREDTTVKGEVKGLDSSVYLSPNTTLENEINDVNDITGQGAVVMNDDVQNVDGNVFLGNDTEVSSVAGVDSFRIGDNADITGEMNNIRNDVQIGKKSVIQDEIDGIGGSVNIGDKADIQDSIENIDDDVSIGEDSSIGSIVNINNLEIGDNSVVRSELNTIGGNIEAGDNTMIKDEVDGVDGNVTLGSDSTAQDSLANIDGNLTIGERSNTSDINTVGGDVILRDDVNVDGSISSIGGKVICGENVSTKGDDCQESL